MSKIIALFSVLIPHLSATTTRQLSQVVLALLSMTGRVTMLNISRWTGQGGSYRTVQRFFNTVIPWTTICWTFFRTYLLDRESDYILVGDEVVVPKAGKSTYGLSRFFSSLFGKAIPRFVVFSRVLSGCQPKAFLPDGYGANRAWHTIVKSRRLCFRTSG